MAENGPEVSVKISSGPLSQISSAYRLNITSESPNSQSQRKKRKSLTLKQVMLSSSAIFRLKYMTAAQ